MSNINYLNQPLVTIEQSPAIINKFEDVLLTAVFDLTQITVGDDSYDIDYEWIYTDDGSSFVSCGVFNDNLNISVNANNSERIYKLKITVKNINHTIQTNTIGTNSIGTTDNIFIITNQSSGIEGSDDTESKVLYSSNYKIKHNLNLSELVKNINTKASFNSLSQEDPTIAASDEEFTEELEDNPKEIITIDTNQNEQYFYSNPSVQSLDTESSTQGWFTNPSCTFAGFSAVGGCGIGVKAKRWSDVKGGCASVATGPCDIIDGGGEITIDKMLGILNNCKITTNGQTSYKYCDSCAVVPSKPANIPSISIKDCGLIPNTGPCTNFAPDILCPDPSISDKQTIGPQLEYCVIGVTAASLVFLLTTILGTAFLLSPVGGGAYGIGTSLVGGGYAGGIATALTAWGLQFSFLKPWIGDGCLGPGLCANGTGFVIGASEGKDNFLYQCNPESWKTPAHVSCMGDDNIYAGCDDSDVNAEMFTPECFVTYSGKGISVNTTITTQPGPNGNNVYYLKIKGTYPVPASAMPKKGCKTITLKKGNEPSSCADAGASLPGSIEVTVCASNSTNEVDLLDGVSFGFDAWGTCVNPHPCLVGAGNAICYSGEDHYVLAAGSAGPGNNCQTQCSKIGGFVAPAYAARPSLSRPVAGGNIGKTVAECLADATAAADGKAFWWRVDELIPNTGASCQLPSNTPKPGSSRDGNTVVGSAQAIAETAPTLIGDYCKSCGCKKNKDCGGGCNFCRSDGSCGKKTDIDHPCYDPDTGKAGVCCAYLDKSNPDSNKHDYVITCADIENCIVCVDASLLNSDHIGTVAHLDNLNPDGSANPDLACCPGATTDASGNTAGKIYNKAEPFCNGCCGSVVYKIDQCDEHCVDGALVPKLCPDGSKYRYTDIAGCSPKCDCITCELCEREVKVTNPDGSVTITCPHYDTTIDAKSTCTKCKVEADANGDDQEVIYSTLATGQTCCHVGSDTWVPADYCCPGDFGQPFPPEYDHACSKLQGCCGETCGPTDKNQCCQGNSSNIVSRSPCKDCDGNSICRFSTGTACCTVGSQTITVPSNTLISSSYSDMCYDPADCLECYTYSYDTVVGFPGLTHTTYVTEIRPIVPLDSERDGYDECKECDGAGSAVDKDPATLPPGDPCLPTPTPTPTSSPIPTPTPTPSPSYSASSPQSIFYEP